MILGPNSPLAIQRKRPYSVTFLDREGNERTFSKFTTWTDFRGTMQWLKAQDVEILNWAIDSPELSEDAEEIIADYFAFEAAVKNEEDSES